MLTAFELYEDTNGKGYDNAAPTDTNPTLARVDTGASYLASDPKQTAETTLSDTQAHSRRGRGLGAECRDNVADIQREINDTKHDEDIRFSVSPSALIENAHPRRYAKSFDEARAIVGEMVGKSLTNRETGMVATISNRSLDKLTSGKAASQSSSRKDHMIAVANIDQLFENAIEGWVEPHKTDTTNIAGVHKMFAPLQIDGVMRLTKLTIKEMAFNQGNRIYSVEAIEVGNENSALGNLEATAKQNAQLTSPQSANSAMPEMTEVVANNSNSAPRRLHNAMINSLIQAIADFNHGAALKRNAPIGTEIRDGNLQ